MGKVFVKGPVESPDDLLAKQAMVQRLQNFKQGMGPKLGAGFEHARNYAGTRDYAGAGRELGTSMGKFANNEIDNFGQFASALADPFFALLGRKPQTPEEEDYARRMIAQQNAQRIEEEMAPQKEKDAYAELGRMGMAESDIKNLYPFMSADEALRNEKLVQAQKARQERLATLRGEPTTVQEDKKAKANEIVAVGGRDPPTMPEALRRFKEERLLDEFMERQDGYNENVSEEPTTPTEELGLGGTDIKVPPMSEPEETPQQVPETNKPLTLGQIKENMGPGTGTLIEPLTDTQSADGQDKQHEEMLTPENTDALRAAGAGTLTANAIGDAGNTGNDESEEKTSGFKTPTRTNNSPYGGFGDPMKTGINPPTNNINDLKRFGS
jgi:hypothetical protein